MMSMVHTQGQKDGCFFVHLTADSLHSVAIFEMEMEDQIRKNGRGGHSAALQKREVDGTTFYILREGHMHLRLHEIVEAGDSVISFDTCLADEV